MCDIEQSNNTRKGLLLNSNQHSNSFHLKKLHNKTFSLLFNSGSKFVSRVFILLYTYNISPNDRDIYAGFVASKKVGPAVHRNRCKRVLRAALQNITRQIYITEGQLRLVLIARKGLAVSKTQYSSVLLDLRKYFQKIQNHCAR